MRTIRKLKPNLAELPKKKKVAAYARVSRDSSLLLHSLSAQVSYYSELIQRNPDWEYAGVYADYAVSGTRVQKREEFQRMLADCESGKIDVILTKSISRFARNTVDLLETVRHLRGLGIEVRFEKEQINTLSGEGEVMLSILASFAQEESLSMSDNIKWSIQKAFQQGRTQCKYHVFGYVWEGGQLVIEPTEAAVVKRVFRSLLDGQSKIEIVRELNAEGTTTRRGYTWSDFTLSKILTNITYTGDLLLQKTFTDNPIDKSRKKNCGEQPQYLIESNHPAIIDKETFEKAQKELARRKALGCFVNKALNFSCFTTKIKCGNCGRNYNRSLRQRGTYAVWRCSSKGRSKSKNCGGKDVPERQLKRVCCEVLGLKEFEEAVFTERVQRIEIVGKDAMVFYLYDGQVIHTKWQSTARQEGWTPERRAEHSEFMRKENARRKAVKENGTKGHNDSSNA